MKEVPPELKLAFDELARMSKLERSIDRSNRRKRFGKLKEKQAEYDDLKSRASQHTRTIIECGKKMGIIPGKEASGIDQGS